MLVDYQSQSNTPTLKIDVCVGVSSLAAPSSITIYFRRQTISSRIIKRVTYNVLVLNTTFMASENVSYYANSFQIYYANPTSHTLFDVQMANFNIPGPYLRSNTTNELCLIGIYSASLYPNFKNVIFFNATTTPFHGMTV